MSYSEYKERKIWSKKNVTCNETFTKEGAMFLSFLDKKKNLVYLAWRPNYRAFRPDRYYNTK